jgi:hypothetical protein
MAATCCSIAPGCPRARVSPDTPSFSRTNARRRPASPQVRGRVAPLLSEVAGGGLRTSEGLSYLEAKHLLLLQYCACLVVYIMLRAEGRKVEGHPVVTRCAGVSSCVWMASST